MIRLISNRPFSGTALAADAEALFVAVASAIFRGVVAVFTDKRPARAWCPGPDRLYQATRAAFGRPE